MGQAGAEVHHVNSTDVPLVTGDPLLHEDPEDLANDYAAGLVDDYEYQFFPSSGKGADVSNQPVKQLTPDTDGKIYLYNATDASIRVIHPK